MGLGYAGEGGLGVGIGDGTKVGGVHVASSIQ